MNVLRKDNVKKAHDLVVKIQEHLEKKHYASARSDLKKAEAELNICLTLWGVNAAKTSAETNAIQCGGSLYGGHDSMHDNFTYSLDSISNKAPGKESNIGPHNGDLY